MSGVVSKHLYYCQNADGTPSFWVYNYTFDAATNTYTILSIEPYAAIGKPIGWGKIPQLPDYNIYFFEIVQHNPERRRVLCIHVHDTAAPIHTVPAGAVIPVFEVLDYSECLSTAAGSDLQIKVGDLGGIRTVYHELYDLIRRKFESLPTPEKTTPERRSPEPEATPSVPAAVPTGKVVNITELEAMLVAAAEQYAADKRMPVEFDPSMIRFGTFEPGELPKSSEPAIFSPPPTPTTTTTTTTTTTAPTSKPSPVKALPIVKTAVAPPQATTTPLDADTRANKDFDAAAIWFDLNAVAKICEKFPEFETTLSARFEKLGLNVLLAWLTTESDLRGNKDKLATILTVICNEFNKKRSKADQTAIPQLNAAQLEALHAILPYLESNPALKTKMQGFYDAQKAKAQEAAAKVTSMPSSNKTALSPPAGAATGGNKTKQKTVTASKTAKPKPKPKPRDDEDDDEFLDKATQAADAERAKLTTTPTAEFARILAELKKKPPPFKELFERLQAISVDQIPGVTLAELLQQSNAENKTLLMLLAACPADSAKNKFYVDLVKFVIKNSGAEIFDRDAESADILIYCLRPNTAGKVHKVLILEAICNRLPQVFKDECSKGDIDYVKVNSFYNMLEELYLQISSLPNSEEKTRALEVCTRAFAKIIPIYKTVILATVDKINAGQSPDDFAGLQDMFDLQGYPNILTNLLLSVNNKETGDSKQNKLIYDQLMFLIGERNKLKQEIIASTYGFFGADIDICAMLIYTAIKNDEYNPELLQKLLRNWILLNPKSQLSIVVENIIPEIYKHIYMGSQAYYNVPFDLTTDDVAEILTNVVGSMKGFPPQVYWNSFFKKYIEAFMEFYKAEADDFEPNKFALELLGALCQKCDFSLSDSRGGTFLNTALLAIARSLLQANNNEELKAHIVRANKIIDLLLANDPENSQNIKTALCITAASMYIRAENNDTLNSLAIYAVSFTDKVDLNLPGQDGNNFLHLMFAELNNAFTGLIDSYNPNDLEAPDMVRAAIFERIKNVIIKLLESHRKAGKDMGDVTKLLRTMNSNGKEPLDLFEDPILRKRIRAHIEQEMHTPTQMSMR